MEVHVDLTAPKPVVHLLDPHDTKKFAVLVTGTGDDEDVAKALAMNGAGPVLVPDQGHVYVDVSEIHRLALLEVPDAKGWETDYEAMLDYARSKGWLDDTGTLIKAHIEWFAPPAS
jgi:hypothetical protein